MAFHKGNLGWETDLILLLLCFQLGFRIRLPSVSKYIGSERLDVQ